jgi:hypothetical protein
VIKNITNLNNKINAQNQTIEFQNLFSLGINDTSSIVDITNVETQLSSIITFIKSILTLLPKKNNSIYTDDADADKSFNFKFIKNYDLTDNNKIIYRFTKYDMLFYLTKILEKFEEDVENIKIKKKSYEDKKTDESMIKIQQSSFIQTSANITSFLEKKKNENNDLYYKYKKLIGILENNINILIDNNILTSIMKYIENPLKDNTLIFDVNSITTAESSFKSKELECETIYRSLDYLFTELSPFIDQYKTYIKNVNIIKDSTNYELLEQLKEYLSILQDIIKKLFILKNNILELQKKIIILIDNKKDIYGLITKLNTDFIEETLKNLNDIDGIKVNYQDFNLNSFYCDYTSIINTNIPIINTAKHKLQQISIEVINSKIDAIRQKIELFKENKLTINSSIEAIKLKSKELTDIIELNNINLNLLNAFKIFLSKDSVISFDKIQIEFVDLYEKLITDIFTKISSEFTLIKSNQKFISDNKDKKLQTLNNYINNEDLQLIDTDRNLDTIYLIIIKIIIMLNTLDNYNLKYFLIQNITNTAKLLKKYLFNNQKFENMNAEYIFKIIIDYIDFKKFSVFLKELQINNDESVDILEYKNIYTNIINTCTYTMSCQSESSSLFNVLTSNQINKNIHTILIYLINNINIIIKENKIFFYKIMIYILYSKYYIDNSEVSKLPQPNTKYYTFNSNNFYNFDAAKDTHPSKQGSFNIYDSSKPNEYIKFNTIFLFRPIYRYILTSKETGYEAYNFTNMKFENNKINSYPLIYNKNYEDDKDYFDKKDSNLTDITCPNYKLIESQLIYISKSIQGLYVKHIDVNVAKNPENTINYSVNGTSHTIQSDNIKKMYQKYIRKFYQISTNFQPDVDFITDTEWNTIDSFKILSDTFKTYNYYINYLFFLINLYCKQLFVNSEILFDDKQNILMALNDSDNSDPKIKYLCKWLDIRNLKKKNIKELILTLFAEGKTEKFILVDPKQKKSKTRQKYYKLTNLSLLNYNDENDKVDKLKNLSLLNSMNHKY